MTNPAPLSLIRRILDGCEATVSTIIKNHRTAKRWAESAYLCDCLPRTPSAKLATRETGSLLPAKPNHAQAWSIAAMSLLPSIPKH